MAMYRNPEKIMVVDDDERFRDICREIVEGLGYNVVTAGNGFEALELIRKDNILMAIIDLKMPKMSGLELLLKLHDEEISIPTVIITAYGSIESAVEAMKLGACDYIVKPSSVKNIKSTIKRVVNEWLYLSKKDKGPAENGRFGIVGLSKPMQLVYNRIEILRNTDNTVMIMGESGVGKELVAKAIHYYGNRSSQPFIPIDCSILGLNIVESELFGHVKGAFTDAKYSKDGLLKLAGNGTVFFDEITEIPLPAQAKLLRTIQEKEIRPVGSHRFIKLEARIIAATNRDLTKAVEEGTFREDLFYRIHVIPISVPPLRERVEDIPLLIEHFIKKYSSEKNPPKVISSEAIELLKRYPWPGNVRELENLVQELIVLNKNKWIRALDLPPYIKYHDNEMIKSFQRVKPLREIEIEAIKDALRLCKGNKIEAAKMLGIGKTTLYEKIKRYGIVEY